MLIAALFLVMGLAFIAVSTYVLRDEPLAPLDTLIGGCGSRTWWDLRSVSRWMVGLVMWPTGVAALTTGVVWLAARRYARPFAIVTAFGAVALVCAGAVYRQAPTYIVYDNGGIC